MYRGELVAYFIRKLRNIYINKFNFSTINWGNLESWGNMNTNSAAKNTTNLFY